MLLKSLPLNELFKLPGEKVLYGKRTFARPTDGKCMCTFTTVKVYKGVRSLKVAKKWMAGDTVILPISTYC